MKKTSIQSRLLSIAVTMICLSVSPATIVTLGGSAFVSFRGADGEPLPDGSIVQIGVFSGVPVETSPEDYTEDEWNSFTPILGVGSANSDSRNVMTAFGTGEFDLPGIKLDSEVDVLPELPARVGARVFDSTTVLGVSTLFNTITSSRSDWILEFPQGVPTIPGTGRADILIDFADQPDLVFEDESNRFQTSIQVGPVVDPDEDPEIRSIVYEVPSDSITLTFNSTPSRLYKIQWSTDLNNFENELADEVVSEGATTTFGPFDNPVPQAAKIFFRVTK